MSIVTADLYDAHGEALSVLEIGLRSFGQHQAFKGKISTLKVYEDNTLVREALSEDGTGKVLVIDGAGSLRFALVGDRIAQLAVDNHWAGIVIFGCMRDSAEINGMPIGIKALGTTPRKTVKRQSGLKDTPVHFGGVQFRPGDVLFADEDGVVTAPPEIL